MKKRKRKSHYHTGTHVSPKAGSCNYRSGWELLVMQWLDASADVKTYAYEPFFIPYVSNKKTGRVRKYLPDFVVEYVDGSKQLIEVKPHSKLVQPTVRKKLAAAQAYCGPHGMTLVIFTEHVLRSIGLLK